jgi:hypothetical protein
MEIFIVYLLIIICIQCFLLAYTNAGKYIQSENMENIKTTTIPTKTKTTTIPTKAKTTTIPTNTTTPPNPTNTTTPPNPTNPIGIREQNMSYDTNNYDVQYHDTVTDINIQNNLTTVSVIDEGGKSIDVPWSKTMGNTSYYKPGTLKYPPHYIPSYEESVYLSPMTGLKYTTPPDSGSPSFYNIENVNSK